MKKSIIKMLAVMCLSAATLISCASTSGMADANAIPPADQVVKANGLIIKGASEDPNLLAKNDTMSVTVDMPNPQYFEFSSWTKIRMMADLLDNLGLHNELSNAQKIKLMNHLFDKLPKNFENGVVREVYLGQFFKKGTKAAKNLQIRMMALTAGPDATIKSEKVLIILANAINTKNGVNRDSGAFVNLDANSTIVAVYNKKLLTDANNCNAADLNKIDTAELAGFDRILTAQAFLQDEDLSNDIKAHNICTAIMNDEKEIPAMRITAMLLEFDYRISKEDVAGAEALWAKIIDYCPNVPGNMTPENLEASNGEALYLLKACLNK